MKRSITSKLPLLKLNNSASLNSIRNNNKRTFFTTNNKKSLVPVKCTQLRSYKTTDKKEAEYFQNIFSVQLEQLDKNIEEQKKATELMQKYPKEVPEVLEKNTPLDLAGTDLNTDFDLIKVPPATPVTPILHLTKEEDVSITTLPNNLRIASVENFNKQAVITILIECGTRFETEAERGLSLLLNKLSFRKSKNYTTEQLAEFHGSISLESHVDQENLSYTAEFYRQRLPEVVQLMADLLLQPILDPAEIEDALEGLKLSVEEQWQNPVDSGILSDALLNACYGNTALGQSTLHVSEDVNRDKLTAFLKKYLRPERVVITGLGVDHEEFVNLVKKHFDFKLLHGQDLPLAPHTYERLSKSVKKQQWYGGENRIEFLEAPSNFMRQNIPSLTALIVACEGVSLYDPDLYAVHVLELLLGGGDSFSSGGPGKGVLSIINRKYLSRYEFHNMIVNHMSYSDTGVFLVHASAKHENAPQLAEAIFSLYAQMLKDVRIEDLKRARARLKSQILSNMEQSIQIALQVALEVMYINKFRGINHFLEHIDKVTMQDLHRVMLRLLSNHKPAITLIGDLSVLPPKNIIDQQFNTLCNTVHALG